MSLIKKSSINISKLKRIEREKKMKLTKNFNINEFIYSKFYNPINQKRVVFDFYEDKELLYSVQKLASQLQVLRNYLNAPISINIAYRPKCLLTSLPVHPSCPDAPTSFLPRPPCVLLKHIIIHISNIPNPGRE